MAPNNGRANNPKRTARGYGAWRNNGAAMAPNNNILDGMTLGGATNSSMGALF